MPETTPVSQLTLLRISPQKLKRCTVFCEVESAPKRYLLQFNEETTIQDIIKRTIQLCQENHPELNLRTDIEKCNLYGSKKNGRQISDLPTFQHKQKLMQTGMKCFYLSGLYGLQEKTQKRKILTASTRSIIQSEIVETRAKGKEVRANKNVGCFCFA